MKQLGVFASAFSWGPLSARAWKSSGNYIFHSK